MQSISLPFKERAFNYKLIRNQTHIWDVCRKKYVLLTPEENVRQHLIALLLDDYNIPKGLIAVEKQIQIGTRKKRYDMVIYKNNLQPFMLIECKEPTVAIDDKVLMQTLNYLQEVQSDYIMISNGKATYIAQKLAHSLEWMDAMPEYV